MIISLSFTTFWQYADSGANPGDQDLFNGDAAGLAPVVFVTGIPRGFHGFLVFPFVACDILIVGARSLHQLVDMLLSYYFTRGSEHSDSPRSALGRKVEASRDLPVDGP